MAWRAVSALKVRGKCLENGQRDARAPVPARAAAALGARANHLLLVAPIGLAVSSGADSRATRPGDGLGAVARKSGRRLHEYENSRVTNPPVTGRLVERAVAADGSHIGRRTPSVDATTHSLLHGRVLIQYQPGLPGSEVRALDRFVEDDPYAVLGFANQTGMTAPVAATAYLSLLTCPRVDATTLHALGAFRDRRRCPSFPSGRICRRMSVLLTSGFRPRKRRGGVEPSVDR
jgi:Protein of unknown function (DUF3105)